MNIQLEGYYNRVKNSENHKDYKELLFRAEDKLQSTEMNDLQGVLGKKLDDLTESFFQDGSIISGIDVTIERTLTGSQDTEGRDLYDFTIENTAGTFFKNGDLFEVISSSFVLPNQTLETSEFKLGIQKVEEIVSYKEDASLVDPGLETRNQGQPGAERLKIIGHVVLVSSVNESDENIFELFEVKGGEIVVVDDNEYLRTVENKIVDISAQYDRNSNGNYVLDGLDTSYVGLEDPETGSLSTNLGPFWFNVSSGSANISGYNFDFDHSIYFGSKPLIDFELHQDEPTYFTNDGWYDTRHAPIRKVFRITGEKEVLNQEITHGNYAGVDDDFPSNFHPVKSISEVRQGTRVFIQGTDYSLVSDKIEWLDTADNEPAPNSTYYVDFKYIYTEEEINFSQGPGSESMGDISADYKKVYLHGFADGAYVQLDYDFILQRRDTVAFNSNGEIVTVKGNAAESAPKEPRYNEDTLLKIADILLSGDNDPIVNVSFNRTFLMSDIQLILDSHKNNQYNVNRIALETDLRNKQPGAHLRSQFIDSFTDDLSRDLGLPNTSLTIGGNLVMDIDWVTNLPISAPLPPEEGLSLFLNFIPTSEPILSQPFRTGSQKVNKYLLGVPPKVSLKLYPQIYRWIDRTVYREIQRTLWELPAFRSSTRTLFRWGGRNATTWVRTSQTTTLETLRKYNNVVGSIEEIHQEIPIPNIPLRLVSNEGAFNQNEEVQLTLDEIDFDVISANTSGSLDETIHFPVPTLSGERVLVATGKDSGALGSTLFTSKGYRQVWTTIKNTVQRFMTRTSWLRTITRVRLLGRDPIAQTFTLEQSATISKIDLKFSVKSTTDVMCVICETDNGYPNSEKVLATSTVPTANLVDAQEIQSFEFTEKVLLQSGTEYAFVVINSDPTAELNIATLGEKTLDAPQKWLTDPAYKSGVLFSSANNSAWTAEQRKDIQFWIYGTNFGTTVQYNYTFSVTDATDLIILSTSEVEENTSLDYKISLLTPREDLQNEFMTNPYEQVLLEEAYTGEVQVSVNLHSGDGVRSPALNYDVQLAVGTAKHDSVYTSVGFDVDSNDAEIVAYLDTFIPTNTDISLDIQVIDPVTKVISWKPMTKTSYQQNLGDEWVESEFKFNLQPSGSPALDVDQTLTRIRIKSETSDDKNRPVASNLRVSVNKI